MPIYEYKCLNEDCSTEIFEEIQSFNDKAEAQCSNCLSNGTRIISAFSVHFKGSGWYSTSNRSSASSSKKADKKSDKKANKKASKSKTDKKASKSKTD
ncbi:zinc ribbon domain-containing protein [Dehalococcoidia bacterium]|nr:zinc ribbon domain-containing protein [Dehalococcoidia bacterium]